MQMCSPLRIRSTRLKASPPHDVTTTRKNKHDKIALSCKRSRLLFAKWEGIMLTGDCSQLMLAITPLTPEHHTHGLLVLPPCQLVSLVESNFTWFNASYCWVPSHWPYNVKSPIKKKRWLYVMTYCTGLSKFCGSMEICGLIWIRISRQEL